MQWFSDQLDRSRVDMTRHEKSGLWFLKHIFQVLEGSSKLAGFFAKNVDTIDFTNLPKAFSDSLTETASLRQAHWGLLIEVTYWGCLIEAVLLRLPHWDCLTEAASMRRAYWRRLIEAFFLRPHSEDPLLRLQYWGILIRLPHWDWPQYCLIVTLLLRLPHWVNNPVRLSSPHQICLSSLMPLLRLTCHIEAASLMISHWGCLIKFSSLILPP